MYLVVSALMLILFDFSHLLRHFSSLLISSAESITLSPGICLGAWERVRAAECEWWQV